MANNRYVSYIRVSTRKQEKSGLGLEGQADSVAAYLTTVGGKSVGEFVEVESGKRNSRPQLAAALALCRVYNATLLVAKLDRLARNVAFIANLKESRVEFVAIDMPTATKFTIHIMASVAEQEADMIAARTAKALETAKKNGTMLGRRDSAIAAFSPIGVKVSAEVRTAKAKSRAEDLIPIIRTFQNEGHTSLRAIAAVLNERTIPTARKGVWTAVKVQRILQRG